MCGIAGIFDLNRSEIDAAAVESMIQTLQHRGPDALGSFVHRHLGLGHTRLSILDLSEQSNQPFYSGDRRYVVVFNGEVFNFVELRDELKAQGVHFRTSSDTEVLVEAFAAWGPASVNRLNGMWAFAIYDRSQDALFSFRDRFGIKPFNYGTINGRFYFASECKAILAVERGFARPNYDAISLVLRKSISGCNLATCFEGIKRLAPGHNLTVSGASLRIERYWDYPRNNLSHVSIDEAAGQVEELLSDSVKIRLRSDVPVGISLSSGLDSTTIAAFVRRHSDQPIDTFTADYGSGLESEVDGARCVASDLQMSSHRVLTVCDNYLELLRRVIHHLGSPHALPP